MAAVNQQQLDRISEQAELNSTYVVLMSTAGVLSAVALLTNSVPILIGAMVVAPAMSPLALVTFAALRKEWNTALRGLWVAAAGIAVAMGFAMATTWLMNVTDVLPESANLLQKPLLEERVSPGWWSLVAAVAAGIAGMLAVAKEKVDTLVGTVAALALVPAAGAGGIAFLSDDPTRGFGGLILLAINAATIIVVGFLTLLVFRPGEERSK